MENLCKFGAIAHLSWIRRCSSLRISQDPEIRDIGLSYLFYRVRTKYCSRSRITNSSRTVGLVTVTDPIRCSISIRSLTDTRRQVTDARYKAVTTDPIHLGYSLSQLIGRDRRLPHCWSVTTFSSNMLFRILFQDADHFRIPAL